MGMTRKTHSMANKEQRRAAAQERIQLVEGLYKNEIQATVEGALLYEQVPSPDGKPARYATTEIEVADIDAVGAAAKAQGKACVLDFASYLHPGGGYDRGAWAQEEALCAESNLFNILDRLRKVFYDVNRNTINDGLYTDRALYLTDVVFVPSSGTRKCDVIVCAAPNRRRALETHSCNICDEAMASRVRTVMGIAAANEVDELVLGAFGCGVFGNNATFVARLFKEWLDQNPGIFRKVVFAVPGGKNLAAFKEMFTE